MGAGSVCLQQQGNRTSEWSKAVRNALHKGGAEFQRILDNKRLGWECMLQEVEERGPQQPRHGQRNFCCGGGLYELLNAQEPVLCSFVRREWESEVTIRTKEVP